MCSASLKFDIILSLNREASKITSYSLSFDCGPGLEKFGTFRLDGEAFAQDFLVWTNGMWYVHSPESLVSS